MIYNFTKCESVIAKIMADLDSSEVRQRTTDIREWIFEAIDKIGAPMQYLKRESGVDGFPILQIQDHQVPMPSDIAVLDGVAYSSNPEGPWVPMTTSTGVFREPKRSNAPHGNKQYEDPQNLTIDRIAPPRQPEVQRMPTTQSQFYTINGEKYWSKIAGQYDLDKPEYFIKPGWIVTNKDKGFIKLSYKSIATDERGYPLIPDLTSYQEAIYWYVVMKLSFPKYLKGKLGGKGVNNNYNVYSYLQGQWNFYRNQAYAEAMMPTADDIQSIKNDWNKLVPDYDADDRFFKDINKEQIVYNDYYYGY